MNGPRPHLPPRRRLATCLILASLLLARPASAQDCAGITVSCEGSSQYVLRGRSYVTKMTFLAKVVGQPQNARPSYAWRVSAGSGTSPRNAPERYVMEDVTRLEGVTILATVRVRNLGQRCPERVVQCPEKKVPPRKRAKLVGVYTQRDPLSKREVLVADTSQQYKAEGDGATVYVVGVPALASAEVLPGIRPAESARAAFLRVVSFIPHAGQQQQTAADDASGSDRDLERELVEVRGRLVSSGVAVADIRTARALPRDPYWSVELWVVPAGADPPPTAREAVSQAAPVGAIPAGAITARRRLLTEKACHDIFGGRVAKRYYCVRVEVNNDSNFDLHLTDIGFTAPQITPPGDWGSPSDGGEVRSAILRGQEEKLSRRSLTAVRALGPVLTGFTPFFRNDRPRANFSSLLNILNSPVESGLEYIFPDDTQARLDALDRAAYAPPGPYARVVVPPGAPWSGTVFFAKEWLGLEKDARDDPQQVEGALGELVVVGNFYSRVGSVTLVGGRAQPLDHSVSGRVSDACGAGLPGAKVALTGAGFATREVFTDHGGAYRFNNITRGRLYAVLPTIVGSVVPPLVAGSDSFNLAADVRGLEFRASDMVVVGGIVRDAAGAPLAGLTLELMQAGTTSRIETGDDGTYSFTVKAGGTYQIKPAQPAATFDPQEVTLTAGCSQRRADFKQLP